MRCIISTAMDLQEIGLAQKRHFVCVHRGVFMHCGADFSSEENIGFSACVGPVGRVLCYVLGIIGNTGGFQLSLTDPKGFRNVFY